MRPVCLSLVYLAVGLVPLMVWLPDGRGESLLDRVKPDIVTRQHWGAKEPAFAMSPHLPRFITVHHTAVRQQPKVSVVQKMRNLQTFSQTEAHLPTGRRKPEWADVPYHFYIDCAGRIAEGRNMDYAGDTNTPYNPTGHIQVVLEGNFEAEEPSHQQLRSLEQLALWLALMRDIGVSDIKGHKDYVATACPGKNVHAKLPELRKWVADKARKLMDRGSSRSDR